MFALTTTASPLRFSWTPSGTLLTPAGNLQGGAALGAAVAALEAVTQRPLVWATAQYLSFAAGTEPIDLQVIVEVAGHQTSQARCIVAREGVEILTTHAALGRRSSQGEGVWCTRPDVPDAQDCAPYRFFRAGLGDIGDIAEFRLAKGRQLDEISTDSEPGDGKFAIWVRCWRGARMMTVPMLAFIGDFMPLGFADAFGAPFSGNSLDNTIRVATLVPTEWILLSTTALQAGNGFAHGRAEMWAEDGTLLGEVSQSVILRLHYHMRQQA